MDLLSVFCLWNPTLVNCYRLRESNFWVSFSWCFLRLFSTVQAWFWKKALFYATHTLRHAFLYLRMDDDDQMQVGLTDELLPNVRLILINRSVWVDSALHLITKLPTKVAFLRSMSSIFSLIFLSFSRFSMMSLE